MSFASAATIFGPATLGDIAAASRFVTGPALMISAGGRAFEAAAFLATRTSSISVAAILVGSPSRSHVRVAEPSEVLEYVSNLWWARECVRERREREREREEKEREEKEMMKAHL